MGAIVCTVCVATAHNVCSVLVYTQKQSVSFTAAGCMLGPFRCGCSLLCFSNYVQVGLIVIPHAQLGCLELFNPCAVPCWGLSRD